MSPSDPGPRHRPGAVERAFELARTGEFADIQDLIRALSAETYLDAASQFDGPSLRAQLRKMIALHRKPA